MSDARIAVAGCQWITEHLVRALIHHGQHPSLVVNMDPGHRDAISGYADLNDICATYSIELYRPDRYSLKSDKDRSFLVSRAIDVLLVFGWQRLIPDWWLDHCVRGAYGVHGGPEPPPRCRGRAVFNWAILLGYKRFLIYMFRLTPDVDDGEIVDMTEFNISSDDDVMTLYHKNCVVSTRMFLTHLPGILAGKARFSPHPSGTPTYLPKRTPEQGGIAWDAPASRIANLVRAVAPPYPGAFTYLEQIRFFIERAHVFDTSITYPSEPGVIQEVFPNGHFVVMTGDHPLYVRQYQCEGTAQLEPGRSFRLRSGEQTSDPTM